MLALPVLAADFAQLKDMDIEINRDPYGSYSALLELEAELSFQSLDDKLLWYGQKAKAEYLLYFYEDLEVTTRKAVDILRRQDNNINAAQIYTYHAIALRHNNHYEDAKRYFILAMNSARHYKQNIHYIFAKQELAYTKSLTELFEVSLNDIQEAYLEAFALDDSYLLAVINESYGAIYGYMDEYEKSIDYYHKALESYEQFGFPAHIGEAIYGLASTYRYWGKYDKAIEYFTRYQETIAYTPNTDITYFSAYGLGMTLAEKGDCTQALEVISQGLKLKGIPDYNAELHKSQAICFIQLKQLDKATAALAQAEEILSNIPELVGTTWHLEIKKIEAQLIAAKSDYQQAYYALQDYYQSDIALINKNSSLRLLRVRAALELERKDIEVTLLQQRSKIQLLEVEREHDAKVMRGYIIVLLACLVIVISSVLVLQRNNHKKVFALSIKDELTGLYNRRYMLEHWQKILDKSHQKTVMAIFVIDVDNFKSINDRFGHPFGDKVLKQIADTGLSVLRAEDVMGRIGGEEFLCLLPRVDKTLAKVIAKRLTNSISGHHFISEQGEDVQVTISVGVKCVVAEDKCDINTLYIQADQALYRAKEQGKNQIVLYDEIEF